MSRILIIEDDPDIALSLKYALEREPGHSVQVIGDGETGLARATADPPDLILLDLNLPGIAGMEVCRALRTRPATAMVPVIMLTARVEEGDKIAGLDAGADDYVTKPFSIREVKARVRAVLRRSSETDPSGVLQEGPIRLDESRRAAWVAERELTLTRKEFDLLAALIRQPGRVLTRERLLQRVWGYDHPGETRTVDVHVRQLRRKLAEAAELIETVVGIGYRFRADRAPD